MTNFSEIAIVKTNDDGDILDILPFPVSLTEDELFEVINSDWVDVESGFTGEVYYQIMDQWVTIYASKEDYSWITKHIAEQIEIYVK